MVPMRALITTIMYVKIKNLDKSGRLIAKISGTHVECSL